MSKVQVDKVVNLSDDGAPQLTYGAELPVGYGLTGAGGLNISGVVTAASAVFSGNVTIGGTLTYEDVTNIDVVGVSTFAGRMNVNSTINANEGINVSAGVITAPSGFSGDLLIEDKIVHTGDTNTAIRFPSTDTITAETGGSERVRITSAGLVGIGTDDPQEDLHIGSNSPYILLEDYDNSREWKLKGTAWFAIEDTTEGSERLRIDSSGRLLLGTTTEGYSSGDDLTIATSGHTGITVRSGTTSEGAVYFSDATSGAAEYVGSLVYSHNTNAMTMTVNGSAALQINSDQEVLPQSHMRIKDSKALYLGDSNDFTLTHDATDCRIRYNHSVGSLKFQLNDNSNVMILDTSGRLLIGGATATQSVGGGSALAQIQSVSSTGRLTVTQHRNEAGGSPYIVLGKSRGTALNAVTILQDDDDIGTLAWAGADGSDMDNQAAAITAQVDGTPGADDMPGRLIFKTTADGASSASERLRITSGGQVNIGANFTQTTYPFSVEGSSNTTAIIKCSGNDTANFYFDANRTGASANISLLSGLWNGTRVADIRFLTGSDTSNKDDGQIALYTASAGNPTERMRLLNDGDVLIQATSADMNDAANLGFTYNHHATGPYIRVKHAGNGGSYANYTLIHFVGGTSVIGEVKQDGDGTITYATSSDYRLKENIVDLTGAITRVKNLKPKRFNFKSNLGLTKDGFLAHELQEVVPESVNGTKDEVVTADGKANNPSLKNLDVGDPVYQTADASRVVPLLTAALKEAIAKIETLETKVAALESS